MSFTPWDSCYDIKRKMVTNGLKPNNAVTCHSRITSTMFFLKTLRQDSEDYTSLKLSLSFH